MSANTKWREIAWIAHGGLRLFYLDRHGNEWNKNFFLANDWLWPLTPSMRERAVNFDIAAMEPTQLWVASWEAVEPLLHPSRAWRRRSTDTLCALLDEKLRREHRLLQCSARERYESMCAEHPEWLQRIPLRHLASYLGMTDVNLSRLRRTRSDP